jgi:hypothetical protein
VATANLSASAVGFEQMEKGALSAKWTDRTNPLDKHANLMSEVQGFNQAPPAAQMFGGAGREYRWKHGTKRETFAKISGEGAPARVEEPVRAVQERAVGGGGDGVAGGVRPADALSVLPADVRRGGGGLCSDDFAEAGIGVPQDVSSFVVIELHDCFTDRGPATSSSYTTASPTLRRGAGPVRGGPGREVHLGRRQHLRRTVRHQPVGRPAEQGAPAGRDRVGAVHRAGLAPARHRWRAPGRGRAGGPAAQPRARRRVRRDDVPAGLR